MKMRLFVTLGAVSVMALGLLGATGCEEGTGGTGGAGGGTGGTGGEATGGSGGTGGMGMGGMGGGGGMPTCSGTCAEAATPGNPKELCADATQTAKDAFAAVQKCACVDSCMMECGTTLCATPAVDPDMACQTCVLGKCGAQFTECANN